MKTTYRYLKNSNTGEIIMEQVFSGTDIKFPKNYYDINGTNHRRHIDLTGFVEISKKRFDRIKRMVNRTLGIKEVKLPKL